MSIFGVMNKCWTTPTANMRHPRSQNSTNMLVDDHGIQTFKVVCCCVVFVARYLCPRTCTTPISLNQIVCML